MHAKRKSKPLHKSVTTSVTVLEDEILTFAAKTTEKEPVASETESIETESPNQAHPENGNAPLDQINEEVTETIDTVNESNLSVDDTEEKHMYNSVSKDEANLESSELAIEDEEVVVSDAVVEVEEDIESESDLSGDCEETEDTESVDQHLPRAESEEQHPPLAETEEEDVPLTETEEENSPRAETDELHLPHAGMEEKPPPLAESADDAALAVPAEEVVEDAEALKPQENKAQGNGQSDSVVDEEFVCFQDGDALVFKFSDDFIKKDRE